MLHSSTMSFTVSFLTFFCIRSRFTASAISSFVSTATRAYTSVHCFENIIHSNRKIHKMPLL